MADSPARAASSAQSHARAEFTLQQTFLGKTVRCHLDDGREMQGRLVAVDSAGNVILQGATECRREVRSQPIPDDVEHRWAGMVAIPAKHILDVDIKASWGQGPAGTTAGPPLPPRAAPPNAFPTDSSLYT